MSGSGLCEVVFILEHACYNSPMPNVHFSSADDTWATPQDFFDVVNAEFHFTLDVCALPSSAKCPNYYTPEDDGLVKPWTGVCWMNPPYGREIGQWMRRAVLASRFWGATVVCLVPARTDTKWWWECARLGEVRFLRGRLKFGGQDNSAPFPSALVIFRQIQRPQTVYWDWGG